MKCQASSCPREATMGTRCALHWMRRTKAGQRLYKYKTWRRMFEKRFAQGLDLRRITGHTGPIDWTFKPRFHEKWTRLLGEITTAFDKGINNDGSDGGAEACLPRDEGRTRQGGRNDP